MEWDAPAIVLAARPYNEGDAVATVLTQSHGAHRGLARGGLSRARAATWQPGNLIEARWIARLSDQLGTLTAELVHPGAALALDDPLTLAVLAAACEVAEGALPEQEPHPRTFDGLLNLIVAQPGSIAALVRWESVLLSDLGYGLDLTSCAITGNADDLAYVSPRTGRAVAESAAGVWRDRLLPLPPFLLDGAGGTPAELEAGLRLTGHFLARDAFGHQHRPLPPARLRLMDRVATLAGLA